MAARLFGFAFCCDLKGNEKMGAAAAARESGAGRGNIWMTTLFGHSVPPQDVV